MASCPCRTWKTGLTRSASATTRTSCGCSSVAEHGPSRLETGVRFPPIRSSPVQSRQRISLMRRAPQPLHRIESTASQTRASSPCRATRAATGTSPECPHPHVIRSVPPRRRPSRLPSRRSSRSCREGPSVWPVPDGRSLNRVSRVGFTFAFRDGFLDRNLLEGIPRDGPSRTDRPEPADIRSPLSDAPTRYPSRPLRSNSRLQRPTRAFRNNAQAAESAANRHAGRCNFPGKVESGNRPGRPGDPSDREFHPARLLRGRTGTCSTRTSGSCC